MARPPVNPRPPVRDEQTGPGRTARGRGAGFDPANRFERIEIVPDQAELAPSGGGLTRGRERRAAGARGLARVERTGRGGRVDDWDLLEGGLWGDESPSPATRFLRDPSRSIVTFNQSPDVGFEASLNPYRGCEHGCIYCYARPTHEYLGFSAGLEFESRILVKSEAPALLLQVLSSPSWKPRVLALSGVTDPYQPVERKLRVTRGCLEMLTKRCNPVLVVTKSQLVVRDRDLLATLAADGAAAVCLSVTTLDPALHRAMEPRASQPALRLETIAALARAGIPVGVLVAPIIPGLNDHEIPAILGAAARMGARFASRVLLRLPGAVAPLFEDWLARHAPERREKVLNRLRALRGGRLNDPRFGHRMRGEGCFADSMHGLFELCCRREGLAAHLPSLSTHAFRPVQPGLFD